MWMVDSNGNVWKVRYRPLEYGSEDGQSDSDNPEETNSAQQGGTIRNETFLATPRGSHVQADEP